MGAGPVASAFTDTKIGVPVWRPNDPDEMEALGHLLDGGSVAPVIDSVYPLEEIADAFRRFGAQQHVGKIVLTV